MSGKVAVRAGKSPRIGRSNHRLAIGAHRGAEVRRLDQRQWLALRDRLPQSNENPRHRSGEWRDDRGRLVVVEVDGPRRGDRLPVTDGHHGVEGDVCTLRLRQPDIRNGARRTAILVGRRRAAGDKDHRQRRCQRANA